MTETFDLVLLGADLQTVEHQEEISSVEISSCGVIRWNSMYYVFQRFSDGKIVFAQTICLQL